MRTWDVIIVGAGPCGLSCAASFAAAGLSAIVLEKGYLVDSIYRFPDRMRFFSGPQGLEIGNVPMDCAGKHPSRSEALDYYRQVIRDVRLHVRQSEPVARIAGRDGGFHLLTPSGEHQSAKVVIATGYFAWPNLLNIQGEDLPKVTHYFKDEHLYGGARALVIGGRNSAGNVALALAGADAEVTLIHRGDRFSMKPWVREALEDAIADRRIRALMNTRAMEIRHQSVSLCTPDGPAVVANDFVFAMTGYHRDHAFLRANRIPNTLNETTFESGRGGVYLAGAMLSGVDGCEVNIENGRSHGEHILRDLARRF